MTVESSTETNTCLGLDAAEVFPTAAAALPFFATEQPMTLSTTNHTTSGTAKVVPILSSRFQRCEGVPIGNFHGGGAPRTQRHSCHSCHSPTLRSCLDLSFAACLGSASAQETFSHQTFGSFQIISNHFIKFQISCHFHPKQPDPPHPMSPRRSFRARSLTAETQRCRPKLRELRPSDRSEFTNSSTRSTSKTGCLHRPVAVV